MPDVNTRAWRRRLLGSRPSRAWMQGSRASRRWISALWMPGGRRSSGAGREMGNPVVVFGRTVTRASSSDRLPELGFACGEAESAESRWSDLNRRPTDYESVNTPVIATDYELSLQDALQKIGGEAGGRVVAWIAVSDREFMRSPGAAIFSGLVLG